MDEPPWLRAGWRHVWLPYTQMKGAPLPLPVVGAEGSRLLLADGCELIDGVASWWTACHGYGHPHLRACMSRQLEAFPHVMFGGLAHEPGYRLAERLAALLPGDLNRVFFSESGSVSVEIAMKMALQYWINRGESGRTKFVSFLGGYHGDTIGAMSVCDPEEGMHSLFRGLLPEQHVVPLPEDDEAAARFSKFLSEHAGECAAVMLEPLVQGAGGMRFHSAATLRRVVERAREAGLLVIFDEIFTGFGRTGTLFASERAGLEPDIVTLSKSLTGGSLPLAASVASDAVFEAFSRDAPDAALMHGPTYMANPLACAAANASLDLFESEPRLAQVASIEARLARELEPCRELAGVVDVRALGAIGVVQLRRIEHIQQLRQRFVEAGVWIRPFGDVVYLTPAFTISETELSRLTGAICQVLAEWTRDQRAVD